MYRGARPKSSTIFEAPLSSERILYAGWDTLVRAVAISPLSYWNEYNPRLSFSLDGRVLHAWTRVMGSLFVLHPAYGVDALRHSLVSRAHLARYASTGVKAM